MRPIDQAQFLSLRDNFVAIIPRMAALRAMGARSLVGFQSLQANHRRQESTYFD